jgi:hypothetical protein
MLFVQELQRRLTAVGSSVLAVAAHPGWASDGRPITDKSPLNIAMTVGARLLAQSYQGGALPALYAATQYVPPAAYVGPGGFGGMSGSPVIVRPAKTATDADVARRLWTLSEKLTGIHSPLTT